MMEKVFNVLRAVFEEVITFPFAVTLNGSGAKIYLPNYVVLPSTIMEDIKQITFKGAQMVLHI